MIAPTDTDTFGQPGPLLSFVVPAYDRPWLLRTALGSLAKQETTRPFEVVVTDDLGLAETRQVVDTCGIDGVRYVRNPMRLGGVGNWNRGLALARGEWVSVLHEDDALYPWFVDRVAQRLGAGVAAVAVRCSRGGTPAAVPRPEGSPRARSYPSPLFLKGAMTPFPGVVFPRALLHRLGGFDERWGSLADFEFWYRLSQQGKVEVLQEIGAFYRVSDSQWTNRAWPEMLRRAHLLRLRIAREQFPENARFARWMARFFTRRNAREYASRFGPTAPILEHVARFDRMPLRGLPSGWVWAGLRLLAPGAAGGQGHPLRPSPAVPPARETSATCSHV